MYCRYRFQRGRARKMVHQPSPCVTPTDQRGPRVSDTVVEAFHSPKADGLEEVVSTSGNDYLPSCHEIEMKSQYVHLLFSFILLT